MILKALFVLLSIVCRTWSYRFHLSPITITAAPQVIEPRQQTFDIQPPCLISCNTILYVGNVSGYSDCLRYGFLLNVNNVPNYRADCECNYLSLCDRWCTTSADQLSSFSSLYQSYCSAFSGLTWGWVSGTGNPATNPKGFYSKYPSLSGTNIIPVATGSVASEPTDAAQALESIGPGHPSCAETIPSHCPKLYTDTIQCWNATSPKYCFCQTLMQESCPGVCMNQTQPRAWLAWVKRTCGSLTNITVTDAQNNTNHTVDVFSSDWKEFNLFQKYAREDLFPWKWRVTQNVSELTADRAPAECPSRTSKLRSFAIINLCSLVATVFLGRRPVVAFLTCGRFGTLGSPWWPLTALLTTGLMIGVTFLNARLVHTTPGYESTPTAQLALLWFCRPRLSWLAILLVKIGVQNGVYVSMGASAILSELVMQALGLYYMGRTVNFARWSGYYRLRTIEGVVVPWGKPAHIMYAGALLWITAIGFVVLNVAITFLGLGKLIKKLLLYVFGRLGGLRESANDKMDGAGWQALKRSMKEDLRRGVIQKFSKKLPPVEEMARRAEPYRKTVQSDRAPTDQQLSLFVQRDARGQPVDVRSRRLTEGIDESNRYEHWLYRMGLSLEALDKFVTVFIWMILPFIGQWLFWVGFVDLAEDLYCPPKLEIVTAIWAVSAVLSAFLRSAI